MKTILVATLILVSNSALALGIDGTHNLNVIKAKHNAGLLGVDGTHNLVIRSKHQAGSSAPMNRRHAAQTKKTVLAPLNLNK